MIPEISKTNQYSYAKLTSHDQILSMMATQMQEEKRAIIFPWCKHIHTHIS